MADNNVLTVASTEGRPGIIIYEALSGVIFHITPISLAVARAIELSVNDKIPYPDPKPYQVEDPSEVAFTPGQVSRAEDNPDYIEAKKAIDLQRMKQWDKIVFEYCAKMPKYPTRESLINDFKSQLDDLKKIAKFKADDDDYDIIMLSFVLTGNLDFAHINRLATQQTALAPAEVAQGIRFFRAKV